MITLHDIERYIEKHLDCWLGIICQICIPANLKYSFGFLEE